MGESGFGERGRGDPAIGPDGFRRDGLVDDTDEIDGPAVFGGPAGSLLEEVRAKLFDRRHEGGRSVGEPRTQVVYERIAEFLAEQAEESAQAGLESRPGAVKRWHEYLRQTQASLERRSEMVDKYGAPRVVKTFHSGGALWHVDLADWRGRHRVRLLYDNTSQDPQEVRLVSSSGEETHYTVQSFETPATLSSRSSSSSRSGEGAQPLSLSPGGSGSAGSGRLRRRLELARWRCTQLAGSTSPKCEQQAKRSVEELCQVALPRLERMLRRELEEGRQLVPTSEDLLEMEAEEIITLLEGFPAAD